jgi:hypothetical protein
MLDFGPLDLPPFAFCGLLGNFDQNFAYVDFFEWLLGNLK